MLEKNKNLKHVSGEQISEELKEKDRETISNMSFWTESRQLPILTEKILLLRISIERFNKESSKYSKILIWLTVIMTIAVVIQIYLLIKN